MIERGERLGINQAVRDAMVEIRRNVTEARSNMKTQRDVYPDPRSATTAMRGLAAMEKRNTQLALMLEDTVSKLKTLAKSPIDDQEKHREELEIAAAKAQFVKVYLEDSTMDLPEQTPPLNPQAATDHEDSAASSATLSEAVAALDLNKSKASESPSAPSPSQPATSASSNLPQADAGPTADTDPLGSGIATAAVQQSVRSRPQAPTPTRASLAQSSFSWMLEPDEPASASASLSTSAARQRSPRGTSSTSGTRTQVHPHRKRPSANANRERTAFLFGEVPLDEADEEGEQEGGVGTRRPPFPGNIFGMEPLGKSKT